jgi:hypothetical protein
VLQQRRLLLHLLPRGLRLPPGFPAVLHGPSARFNPLLHTGSHYYPWTDPHPNFFWNARAHWNPRANWNSRANWNPRGDWNPRADRLPGWGGVRPSEQPAQSGLVSNLSVPNPSVQADSLEDVLSPGKKQ